MTRVELDDYYLLQDMITECEENIAKAEALLYGSPHFDTNGVSSTPSPQNRVENAYIKIIEQKNELLAKKAEYERLKVLVEQYISNIGELFVRRIFEKRFIQRKRWSEIADELGGQNTAGSVSKICYRYLEKHPNG
ncbi:MAG: hypothetical protein NC299_13355 [Lachnospiraceae bacterium]|nr:hypothetical protein [Ruminococcus sp.]MCM1276323.1 hypothetical protein [Lachnospiraceae bacterium]